MKEQSLWFQIMAAFPTAGNAAVPLIGTCAPVEMGGLDNHSHPQGQ
jgi:hypothetical protein